MIHEMNNPKTTPKTGTTTAAVIGVSGYSGMETARILSAHPGFSLTLAVSDRWAGRAPGRSVAARRRQRGRRRHVAGRRRIARLGSVDLVFLCTPAEVSMDLAPRALAAGARVVDVSGAFRLAAADYPRWYGFTHACPDLLDEAVYSMPEATGATDNGCAARGWSRTPVATPRPARWRCCRCCRPA